MIRSTSRPATRPASLVACRWLSLKYAGTVMTAWLTFSPRYASAASFSLRRIMAEISGGEYCLPRTSIRASPLAALTTLYGTSLISWRTSSWRRPMNRLIEKTVFSGFVMACRLATCPTRISPSFVNPTTEGVRRLPSWFAITVGLPPSTTETTEFVVPRSMPITFGITVCSIPWGRGPYISSSEEPPGPLRDPLLDDVDLDLLGFELFRLRPLDLKNTGAVGCLPAIGLHRHRQLNEPLELAVGAIDVKQILLLDLVLEAALTLDRKQVARDRHTHVLLAHAG